MATFKPLLLFMVTLVTVFLFTNLIIAPIYDLSKVNPTGASKVMTDVISNGWSLNLPLLNETATIKPVSWFYLGSETVETFLVDQLTYIGIMPNIIQIPIFVILFGSLGWSIIIIVKDIIPFT